jgi:uncharacterized protein (DUF58 family)
MAVTADLSLIERLRLKFRAWIFLEKKPEVGETFLNQRRVYTLPSKAGWMFVVLLIALFVGATNYSLSLGFALTFVLASCGMVNTFFGFRNLAYLHLRADAVAPVFAGEEAQFRVSLINRTQRTRYALWVGFLNRGKTKHPEQAVDVLAESSAQVTLSYPTTTRGLLLIPRVCIQTYFPLGLLRAWTTWLPAAHVLVYPEPEAFPPPLPVHHLAKHDGEGHIGEQDFSGVRPYQAGDPLKHLAWKHIARLDNDLGGQLVSKQFAGGSAGDLLLDFDHLPKFLDLELKLSRLTSWVMQADALGLPYAFHLGAIKLAPTIGLAHRSQCLEALALFSTDMVSAS